MASRNDTGVRDSSESDRLIETLRGIIGALNAHGLGGGNNSIPVALAKVETRLDHLEKTTSNTQKILIGLAISVLTLIISMVIEGVFRK